MLPLYPLLIAEPPGEPAIFWLPTGICLVGFLPKTGNTKSHSEIPISVAFQY
jgi:hypothetical protein